MSVTLDQIVARLLDPETPVIWLDPSTPDGLWADLARSLPSRGLAVLNLDDGRPILDHDSLLERFAEVAPVPVAALPSLPSLRECLLRLPHVTSRGWVVMFHRPESLRQFDEATFEDFLEVLAAVHESQYEIHNRVFKLVVRD
jgi:hypothetical protein